MVKNEESKAREAVDQAYRNRMKEGQDETQETEDDWDSPTLTTPDGTVQIPDSEDEGQAGLWPS